MDRGNGAAELISDQQVANGFWHSVSVHFTPTLLEIVVDGNVTSSQLTPGGSRYLDLDLGENVFIGKSDFLSQNDPFRYPRLIFMQVEWSSTKGPEPWDRV